MKENPLFPIARAKHFEDRNSQEFPFLHSSENNSDTYTLGFCRGVSHAAGIWQIQIDMLLKQVQELKALRDVPTLERQ